MINLKIKTNGTVRNLTLPYPGQSIPDIIEKNSVVTVSEVTEPESLKYMEAVRRLHDESDFEKLSAAMQMADVDDSGSMAVIANQLSDFRLLRRQAASSPQGAYRLCRNVCS